MQNKIYALLFIVILLSFKLFAQDTLVFNVKYLKYADTTLVFTPANKQIPKNGFPLLYLLHGYDGDAFDWNKHTKVQDFSDKYGFIIVCPNGYLNSWYMDSPFIKNNQYRQFFNNDLIPTVHKKYKIDSSAIFITGLSMGGEGAINIYVDNQSYFKSAGSMSGILDITAFPKNWELPELLGDYKTYEENWKKYSCVENLKKIKNKKKPLLIDCGTEDFAFAVNKKFAETAKKNGINVVFKTRPGKHEWSYWVESLTMHLTFFRFLAVQK